MSCENNFYYHIDKDLQEYVDLFYQDGSTYGKTFKQENLIVRIAPLNGPWGLTVIDDGGDGQVTVTVDKELYEQGDIKCIESVVFHELGHALLRREHWDSWPSIMSGRNAYGCYREFMLDGKNMKWTTRDELVYELFNKQLKP